jgi:hypothetical protein
MLKPGILTGGGALLAVIGIAWAVLEASTIGKFVMQVLIVVAGLGVMLGHDQISNWIATTVTFNGCEQTTANMPAIEIAPSTTVPMPDCHKLAHPTSSSTTTTSPP